MEQWFLMHSIEVISYGYLGTNFKRGESTKYMWTYMLALFNWTHVTKRFMAMLVAMKHT